MGFRRCMLRGLAAVRGEWLLVCAAFNLRRLRALASSSRSAAPLRGLLRGCDPARRTSRERGRRRSA